MSLAPRFLDTFQAAATRPDQSRATGNPYLWSAQTFNHSNNQTALAREQVKHFTYWNYVAIKRICDKASEPFPHFGFRKTLAKGIDRNLSQRQHAWIRQSYGATYLQSQRDDLQPIPDTHPLVTLLENVNGFDTYGQFIYETVMFYLLTGKFFWWVVPNGFGLPVELHVIPTQWVEPNYNYSTGVMNYWEVWVPGKARPELIPPEDMICYRSESPQSKLDGWAATQAGANWIDSSENIEACRANLFKAGINPDVIVQFEGQQYQNPGDDILDRIKEKFFARSRGVRRWAEPMLVPPGVKVERWSNKPTEMGFPESSAQARDNNLALLGVPKITAGISEDYNHATADAASWVFADITMNPLFRRLAGVFTEHLASRYDRRIRCWYDDCRPMNAEQRRQEIELLYKASAILPNEIRTEFGLDPINKPEFNTAYIAMGMRPIEQAFEAPEPPELPQDEPDDDDKDPPKKSAKADDSSNDDE